MTSLSVFSVNQWLVRHWIAAAVSGIAMACGADSSSSSDAVELPDNFDQLLETCLADEGFADSPLENVVIKFDNDLAYREAFETCVNKIAPDQAEWLTTAAMSAHRSISDMHNTVLLEALYYLRQWPAQKTHSVFH